uniref:Uncharacterized protein n=1 Tax=Arion vulgaris TaxID=1028688 RepID=A0A0B7ARP1_9EUPU
MEMIGNKDDSNKIMHIPGGKGIGVKNGHLTKQWRSHIYVLSNMCCQKTIRI